MNGIRRILIYEFMYVCMYVFRLICFLEFLQRIGLTLETEYSDSEKMSPH